MFRTKKPKVGVSLSGGSAYGMAHIGVLRAFEEMGVKIDVLAGASAGALVGALYAFGLPLDRIQEEASKISWATLSNVTPSNMGFISNKSLGAHVTRLIGEKKIEDADIPFAITATDIRTGEQVLLRSGSVAEAVRASAAIPGVFSPVMIDDVLLVDGGLSENLPYVPLREMGAQVCIGVDVIAHAARYNDPKRYADILANTYNILIHRMNATVRKRFDVLIDPDLSKYMVLDLSKSAQIIEAGYLEGMQARRRIVHAIEAQTKLPFWKRR